MTQALPIYLDNSATSWPKPPAVAEAMARFLDEIGASPGRSGHSMSIEAGRITYRARAAVAELFGAPDPLRVLFGLNATEGINQALFGLLDPGDHVVTSSMEHNSVMRPLRRLEEAGLSLSIVGCSPEGELDPADLEAAIRPDTRLVVLNHASNVTGRLLPVAEAGRICRERDLLLLVDTAQTGGCVPINMEEQGIDLLAFTGHKGLLGPQGTGGLLLGDRVNVEELRPLHTGGTGSRSELEVQPEFAPDKFESGTPNAVGLAGLLAGVRFVLETGVEEIRKHEERLMRQLLDGLAAIRGVTLYGGLKTAERTATLSFNVAGMRPSELGLALDEEVGVQARTGLHCAPAAHRTVGTYPGGSVRFSPGYFTTEAEMEAALAGVAAIARRGAQ